ncbi:MAG: DUF3592 domain-containing protein [Acidimicrobiia bacterium]
MTTRGGGCLRLILGLILIPVLLGGLAWFLADLDRVLSHEKVEAVVVDLIPSVDSDGETVYAPVYEYEVDGSTYRYQSSVSLGGVVVPDIGDPKTLLYNPNDPADARVDNVFLLLWLPGIMVVLSALVLFLLISRWVRRSWRARETEWPQPGQASSPPWSAPQQPAATGRETITATFMGVEASPMDEEGRVRYRVRARTEVDGEYRRYESNWLDEDPTLGLMKHGNQVEVRVDPDNPTDYEVIIPE